MPKPVNTLHAATLTVLAAAERETTPMGCLALAVAARIDRAADTGSSLAALARQLEATLNSAMVGAAVVNTAADDLRARRDAKRRGA